MEADHPWEALNLDDSDFPSLLRPCNGKPQGSPPPISLLSQPTHSLTSLSNSPVPFSPNLIPGPAGAVQAAMLRKLQKKNNPLCIGEESLPTQEYIRRAVEDPGAGDDDFSRDPWLFAVEFIRREGLTDDGGTIGTPLSWIKTEPKLGNRKVAQVIAMIKSCTPNGLGDLMVTLKDPTGTIDASIHGKVLVEGGFGNDITVGTVLILQKVSVFSPLRSARYLNITLNNVVKAISKNTTVPLSEQNPASNVISTVHGIGLGSIRKNSSSSLDLELDTDEHTKQTWNQQKVSSLSPDRNAKIMNSLGQTGYMRGRVQNDKGIEGDEALGSSCCNRSLNAFAGKEPSMRQDIASGMKKATVLVGTNINELEENVVVKPASPQHSAGRDNYLESNQSGGGANLFGVANNTMSVTINGDKKQRELPNSRGLLPQWTDEQLDELCSFD